MMNIEGLYNESDVEQKLVYPLLTEPRPNGLGIDITNIRTKPNIKSLAINKRKNKKSIYPDYVVVISGFPLLVIEVKAPGEDLEEAYREARLYSSEINSLYPHQINPATRVFCTNGNDLWAGYSDDDTPKHQISLYKLEVLNPIFSSFIDDFKFQTLQEEANALHIKHRAERYYQPLRMIGGQAIRNEEVGTNTFGSNIALDYQHLFNPTTTEERAYIVKEAYIISKSRERYLEPIDKIVRAAIPPSEANSKVIYSDKPQAIIKKLQNKNKNELEHKILLLIGSVGSGKSTFVDYLRYEVLPKKNTTATEWIRVDMNESPLENAMIYDWICEQIIAEFRRAHCGIDFDELPSLMKLYSVEIKQFQKLARELLKEQEYNSELYKTVERLQLDKKQTVKAYLRYLCAERGKLAILVLDNCDKRIRDEQLMMFQAAQWLQHEFRCLIFLPLRDITYDNHRNEPPLDTALKDLVFRIEPPSFQEVLIARINLALKEMQKKSSEKTFEYQLPNQMRVTFPAEKLAYFLTSILKSLFEHDKYLRRMIVGLAGRNLRKAMEIFLDFCKSRHITEDQILKICNAKGNYSIPFYIVSRVLMRMNRRFYNSDSSYVKNLFFCNPDDPFPFHFSRLAILQWLYYKHKVKGPINQPGYHKVSELKRDLYLIGLNDETIQQEVLYLLQARCIIAEHLRVDQVENDDLVSLAPAGFVHLDLINTVDYLSAVSEDTYFSDINTANSISQLIGDRNKHYSLKSTLEKSKFLIDYLNKNRDIIGFSDEYLDCLDWRELLSLKLATDSVESAIKKRLKTDSLRTINNEISKGDVIEGVVKNITKFGIFVNLDSHIDGLIHKKNLEGKALNSFKINSKIQVLVLSIDKASNRIRLVPADSQTYQEKKELNISLPKSKIKKTKSSSQSVTKDNTTQLEINLWPDSL